MSSSACEVEVVGGQQRLGLGHGTGRLGLVARAPAGQGQQLAHALDDAVGLGRLCPRFGHFFTAGERREPD